MWSGLFRSTLGLPCSWFITASIPYDCTPRHDGQRWHYDRESRCTFVNLEETEESRQGI